MPVLTRAKSALLAFDRKRSPLLGLPLEVLLLVASFVLDDDSGDVQIASQDMYDDGSSIPPTNYPLPNYDLRCRWISRLDKAVSTGKSISQTAADLELSTNGPTGMVLWPWDGGDVLAMTATCKDLHDRCRPWLFATVRWQLPDIWAIVAFIDRIGCVGRDNLRDITIRADGYTAAWTAEQLRRCRGLRRLVVMADIDDFRTFVECEDWTCFWWLVYYRKLMDGKIFEIRPERPVDTAGERVMPVKEGQETPDIESVSFESFLVHVDCEAVQRTCKVDVQELMKRDWCERDDLKIRNCLHAFADRHTALKQSYRVKGGAFYWT